MNAPPVATQTNPFPGLRPFREGEEYLFFGREQQVDAMLDKLAATHFLAVVGTSGSGKSSLVNCGLRPALHRGLIASAGTAWRMAQFRPGNHPIRALAEALAAHGGLLRNLTPGPFTPAELIETTLRMSKLGLIDAFEQARVGPGVNLLVVADQFEELFRYRQVAGTRGEAETGFDEEATAFVNLLLEVREHPEIPINVVLTMRSDFLGDCAQFSGLPEAINQGQYLVPRMTRDERRRAIEGPAGVGGARIAPVLLTRLVNDVGDNPDQLSILQHALNRTWARWESEGAGPGPLELHHYEAIGTMAHALDQHAEEAYGELDDADRQKVCEKLFKALTDKGTDARGIRRPTRLAALSAMAGADEEALVEVIDVFRDPARSFLMPPAGEPLSAETVIDISHESLMRVWERLKKWTDEEARSAQIWRRLAETAELHRRGDASPLEPPELDAAKAWRARQQPSTAWAERYRAGFAEAMAFLDQSAAAWDERVRTKADAEAEQRRAEELQRQREARARQNLYWGSALAGVLGLACLAMLALWQDARREAEAARTERVVAEKAKADAEKSALDAQQDALAKSNLLAEKQRLEYTLERGNDALQVALKGASADTQARVEKTLNERPLVYIQYADPDQAELAQRLSRQLNEANYSSPGVEKVGSVPSRSELRYFRAEDAETARTLQAQLEKWNAGPVLPKLVISNAQARPLRHFELWLAAAGNVDLAAKVAELNSEDRATRLAAGQLLQSQYRDSAEAIRRVLETYEPPKLDMLSAEGRINGLYYLSRSDPKAWTPELLARGRAIARTFEEREARGVRIGPQTRAELDAWKQKVLSALEAS